MKKETPVILEEQKVIMDWSKRLRKRQISTATIIESLITKNKYESASINEGLKEVRELYSSKNSGWRNQVLKAIMLEQYRLENDIKEGQIVTDGTMAGYAKNVDYTNRNFEVSVYKDGGEVIGLFDIDNFRKA